ncbi:MAG: cupin domain-containing protein [Deltaproteobacteria bacterium]|nr:cupin domain-containing protein [Deltaproteobacteria bacterium]
MATFYDQWLAVGAQLQEEFKRSPMVARDRDIPWLRTRQDAKVKLMLSNDLGFPTMGGVVLKGEIPVGWHTGRHSHGEESIHILRGRGFSMIDNMRYDWREGATLQIPYRAEHQHFNTGSEPAQYVSAMCLPLEVFMKLGSLQQIEDCGPNDAGAIAAMPGQVSEYLKDGRRVLIHLDDAPSDPDLSDSGPGSQNQHFFRKYLAVPRNGFKAKSVAITRVFEEPPGYHSGRHRHLEAVLYVLDGEGYSEIEGNKIHWEPGDVLHVPPAMFEHEHYNHSSTSYRLLQIKFGMRAWFTEIWPEGYTSRRTYDESGKPIIAGPIH